VEGKMQIVSANRNDRLYQELTRQLTAELMGGTYPVGSRLPAEREIAAH
jgi:GntR family transcriptional repressor for pyruvate dehydrogenase complex